MKTAEKLVTIIYDLGERLINIDTDAEIVLYKSESQEEYIIHQYIVSPSSAPTYIIGNYMPNYYDALHKFRERVADRQKDVL